MLGFTQFYLNSISKDTSKDSSEAKISMVDLATEKRLSRSEGRTTDKIEKKIRKFGAAKTQLRRKEKVSADLVGL